ncbi:MAG: hypothetical protein U0269_22240 [Polyangiales bacterium]
MMTASNLARSVLCLSCAALLEACVESVSSRDASIDRAMTDSGSAIEAGADDADASVDAALVALDAMSDSAGDSARVVTDASSADGGASCAGRPFGASCADGLVCDGRGACAIRRPCTFESAGRWLYPEGMSRSLLETVFAYGRYYNFWIRPNGTYEPLNPGGSPTASVDRWRGVGQACSSTNPCRVESFNLWTNPGDPAIMETLLRAGRYFTYASAQGYRLVESGFIEGVVRWSRVANGPCADQPDGECRFDTRSLVMNWGTSQLVREEITARGRRWVYDGGGRPLASVPLGQPLSEVARYAPSDGQGPCSGVTPCRFDGHFHDPTSGDEFVIARGRLFAWANDAENTRLYASGYGNELHTFGRYATGPCRVAP